MEQAEVAVRQLLDRYIDAVQREDLDAYGEIVAHDASMVNFGSFGPPIVGWDSLRAVMEGQNAALDAIRIEQTQVAVHLSASGADAWATSLWRFRARSGETELDLLVRCTWQLQRRDGRWWVVHFHKSVPAG